MTYDVIIISKTFYTSSCTDVENFVSILQVVAEKNTKVLCGQTDKDKQTDLNAIHSPSVRVKMSRCCISLQILCNQFIMLYLHLIPSYALLLTVFHTKRWSLDSSLLLLLLLHKLSSADLYLFTTCLEVSKHHSLSQQG